MVTKKILELLIGKLTHVSYVIPLPRNFLYRLQEKLKWMKANDIGQPTKLLLDPYEIGDIAIDHRNEYLKDNFVGNGT